MIELGRRDCLAPTFRDSHPELMLRKSSYTCNKGKLESNWAEPQVSVHEHLGCPYGEKRGESENSADVWRARWGKLGKRMWRKKNFLESTENCSRQRQPLLTQWDRALWGTECDSGSSKQTALSLCHSCL